MRRVRRNSDAEIRKLERRASESGDLQDALRLYWVRRRAEGPREYMDFPSYRIELPRLGPVLLAPQGDSIRVLSPPGPGHDPEPVTVNRVEYRVSGSYHFFPELGWVPLRPDQLQRFLESPLGLGPRKDPSFDPTSRWLNTFALYRVGQMGAYATDAAYKKFMKAMDKAIKDWIDDHPEEMALGHAISANNAIWRAQEEYENLHEQIADLEQLIGESVLDELRYRR